jgi:hypothetical protein
MLFGLYFLALPTTYPSITDACLQYLNAALDIQHNHDECLYKKLLYACYNDLAKQLSSC